MNIIRKMLTIIKDLSFVFMGCFFVFEHDIWS